MNRKGFTLTEALMAAAILGVIATILPTLFIQVTRFIRLSEARAEIQRDVRQALEQINRNLRESSAATLVIDKVSGQPPCSRIAFTGVDGKTYKFYQSGKTLFMEAQGQGAKALTKSLRYIAFTYPRTDDNRILSVSITTEKATYAGATKALQLSIEKVRIMNP